MDIQNYLIYRDALILVLNKPSGIAVHSGAKKQNGIDQFFDDLKFGLPKRPELAHRLDKDTSGCLILGRHAEALRRLARLFEEKKIKKSYLCIAKGILEEKQGIIDAPLSPQSDKKYQWWMKVDSDGKEAVTEYEVLGEKSGYSYVRFTPKTGRTHQLRVHMAHKGCPIVGDWIYGDKEESLQETLCLHAFSLEIPLYPKKDPLYVEADLPLHMKKWVEKIMMGEAL